MRSQSTPLQHQRESLLQWAVRGDLTPILSRAENSVIIQSISNAKFIWMMQSFFQFIVWARRGRRNTRTRYQRHGWWSKPTTTALLSVTNGTYAPRLSWRMLQRHRPTLSRWPVCPPVMNPAAALWHLVITGVWETDHLGNITSRAQAFA